MSEVGEKAHPETRFGRVGMKRGRRAFPSTKLWKQMQALCQGLREQRRPPASLSRVLRKEKPPTSFPDS